MKKIDFFAGRNWPAGPRPQLVFGGIAVSRDQVDEMNRRLDAVKLKHGVEGLLEWSAISVARWSFYYDYVNVFFEAAARQEMEFACLSVDRATITLEPRESHGKLFVQLLHKKVGLAYEGASDVDVILDKRAIPDLPPDISNAVNEKLRYAKGRKVPHINEVRFWDPATSALGQLTEILVTAVSDREDAANVLGDRWFAIARHVMQKASDTCFPYKLEGMGATTFKIWPFVYRSAAVEIDDLTQMYKEDWRPIAADKPLFAVEKIFEGVHDCLLWPGTVSPPGRPIFGPGDLVQLVTPNGEKIIRQVRVIKLDLPPGDPLPTLVQDIRQDRIPLGTRVYEMGRRPPY